MLINSKFFIFLTLFFFSFQLRAKEFREATGERVSLEHLGFSIIPPPGWEYSSSMPDLKLFMRAKVKPYQYRPNIQVLKFEGPHYIDAQAAERFQDKVIRLFSRSGLGDDFSISINSVVELVDGSFGVLYYSDFTLAGNHLMQAHLLTSSADSHFLITFTDSKEHFEGVKSDLNFNDAWQSILSLQLKTKAPVRYASFVYSFAAGLLLLLVFFMIFYIRSKRAKSLYEKATEEMLDL